MTRNEYLAALENELTKRQIGDTADIVEEYEQHFAFKLADGFSEEEIAAKLGDPAEIAAQYEPIDTQKPKGRKKGAGLIAVLKVIAVSPAFLVAFIWVAALAVASFGIVFVGACLIAFPLFPQGTLIIPYMPYWSGAILGAAVIALGGLMTSLTVWCGALTAKLMRAFSHSQKSLLSGKKSPPYVVFPIMVGKRRRRLRRFTLILVALFVVFFTAAFTLMCIQAGALGFWHAWGWFNYVG